MATEVNLREPSALRDILSRSVVDSLIPAHRELVPDLSELYEFELAFYESQLLGDEDLIRNGAYFAMVGDTLTRHFLMCSGEPLRLPQHSSSRLKSFFSTNQFRTGYATHGLFPYRGKFHPQMIKGLINAMGLVPGETILDPMMGSGTVLIEATLMGIKSIGYDISPFCRFMTQAKLDALTVPLDPIRHHLADPRPIYEHFRKSVGHADVTSKTRSKPLQRDFFSARESPPDTEYSAKSSSSVPAGIEPTDTYNFLLLAYLDSVGYSERSNRKSPYDQFCAILERYVFVAAKIQHVLSGMESELAQSTAVTADARSLALPDASVHGILFSPPYSSAIDYLANDSFHLNHLGVNIPELRESMVGLRGGNPRNKLELYKSDMGAILRECARVLVPGRICAIVAGTNNNQLSKILGVPPDQVQGINELLVQLALPNRLRLVRRLSRRIAGMANTMRTEYIIMLQRG